MRSLWLLIPLMLSAAPAAVDAQETELGSRIVKTRVVGLDYSREQSIRGAHGFAQCMVHRRPSQAVDYLRETEPKRLQLISTAFERDIECISVGDGREFESGGRLNASAPMLRGLVAEEMLKQRYAAGMAALPPEPLLRRYASAWTAVDGRDGVVDEMAVCVVSIDPAGVRALLASTPAGMDEASAMDALSPSLGRCLAANATLRGNRQSIRAALAEAMFHRVTGPAIAASVEGGKN